MLVVRGQAVRVASVASRTARFDPRSARQSQGAGHGALTVLVVHSGDHSALPLPQQLQRSPSGKARRRTTSPTKPTKTRRTQPLASLIASSHDARAALGAVNERSRVATRPGLRWSRQRRHPRTRSCDARHRARSSLSMQHRPRTTRGMPLALVWYRRRRPCASRAGSPRSVGTTRACCASSAVATLPVHR